MHGHGLRRIFDTARCAQTTVSAQRVVSGAMAVGATLDVLLIPCFDTMQQTHAVLMRDVAGNPHVIESGIIQHSAIATARRVRSR